MRTHWQPQCLIHQPSERPEGKQVGSSRQTLFEGSFQLGRKPGGGRQIVQGSDGKLHMIAAVLLREKYRWKRKALRSKCKPRFRAHHKG